jgi:hypothetical protein
MYLLEGYNLTKKKENMPYPNKKIDENVFLDPTTEKVSDSWNVFKKIKDAVNDLIGARGEADGVPSLGSDSKIPIEQIPASAVNPNLESRFDKIISHNSGLVSPATPKIGQIWHDTSDSVLKTFGENGWQPLGGNYTSLATGGIIRESRTVVLKKGVYYLMPVSGDGSRVYWNGFQGIRHVVLQGNKGEDTTIELDGFTSRSRGGDAGSRSVRNAIGGAVVDIEHPPGTPASSTGLFGVDGRGYVPLTDIRQISETKTATITIGAGGAQAHASTAAGAPGWCVIWKLN